MNVVRDVEAPLALQAPAITASLMVCGSVSAAWQEVSDPKDIAKTQLIKP